ncbi:MAG: transglutaminase domain-containing protein [Methanobacterium sp.]|uniref:transglutaminase-like domain-containing protein n=1 Tax=Methanobacterium sp. TaxID=2164 RepID=UPI003D64FD59|nr:transglutaminase domain-containing protein [Methanobacterium sp.]
MVICTVPSSWSLDSQDVSKESQIALNYKNIPTVSATSTVKVNAASKIRKKVKAKKVTKRKVTKKVKAVKRYKVKVRYFYKGKWRTKYVYRTYTPVAVSRPAPAPVIRDVPYWECYGPSANCQSDNADIISYARYLSTIPNPDPRPPLPTAVDSPGAEPQQSNYIDETAYNTAHSAWESTEPQQPGDEPQLSDYPDETAFNTAHATWASQSAAHSAWASTEPQQSSYLDTAAYNAAHATWASQNTAYQDYLTAKAAYDNWSPTVVVSDYQKAVNIFEEVQHKTAYSYYYNTQRGAYRTLTERLANCCDHAHAIVALARAAGLPARYKHGDCTFNSGLRTGHVWAEIWADGRWYCADAISLSNSLGTINNWNTGTWTLKGIYSSLPF